MNLWWSTFYKQADRDLNDEALDLQRTHSVNPIAKVSVSYMRRDRNRVWRREPISCLLHGLSPDSLLIHSLMEEPLQPAHSNQLRSGGVLPHTHYLSLTELGCSSHRSSLVCWKSQSFTFWYHLVRSMSSLFVCFLSGPRCVFLSLFTSLPLSLSLFCYDIQETSILK